MKKIFPLIIAFMALVLPTTANASDDKSTPQPIILSTHPRDNEPNPIIPRAPMSIPAEAWYDTMLETISIIYYGEADGKVDLYKDGQLIESTDNINTTFQTDGPGLYTIEITTESWNAIGSIEI